MDADDDGLPWFLVRERGTPIIELALEAAPELAGIGCGTLRPASLDPVQGRAARPTGVDPDMGPAMRPPTEGVAEPTSPVPDRRPPQLRRPPAPASAYAYWGRNWIKMSAYLLAAAWCQPLDEWARQDMHPLALNSAEQLVRAGAQQLWLLPTVRRP